MNDLILLWVAVVSAGLLLIGYLLGLYAAYFVLPELRSICLTASSSQMPRSFGASSVILEKCIGIR